MRDITDILLDPIADGRLIVGYYQKIDGIWYYQAPNTNYWCKTTLGKKTQ